MPAGLALNALQGSTRLAAHAAAVTNAPWSHVNPRLEPVPCSGRIRRALRTRLGHAAERSWAASNATCRDSRPSRDSDQRARVEPVPISRRRTATA
jgi:hypothetical protein